MEWGDDDDETQRPENEDAGDDTETPDIAASLTPYPMPDPTEAPMPVPSSKVSALTPSSELVTASSSSSGAPHTEATEYDGPDRTDKTLKDLAKDLGAPDSIGTLLDDMQDAIIGIVGDFVSPTPERTGLAQILGHGNRLRGIGALCVLVALVGLALDSTVGQSIKAAATAVAE